MPDFNDLIAASKKMSEKISREMYQALEGSLNLYRFFTESLKG